MRILLVFQSILFYLVYHYTILSLLQINDKHYLSLVDYDVDVVDRMANVNYEFEVPEHDVTVEDIQYHFNQWLTALGYVIEQKDR